MTTGQIIKKLREERQMTQEKLADLMGYSHKSSINKIEMGKNDLPQSKLVAFAKIFNVEPSTLIGVAAESDDANSQNNLYYKKYGIQPIKTKRIPMLGEIACGVPIYTNEDRESYVEVGADIKADFCLRAKGDSMINARINDGDIVFIREQPTVNNGEIAVVIINDEATLKRVYYSQEQSKLVLQAENPKYEPFVYCGEELNLIRILGKALAFQSDIT